MRTKDFVIVCTLILIAIISCLLIFNNTCERTLEVLPKPEVTEGERGQLGIDKNINETNIDNYLERSDSVYRDMRMLKDPGNYEAIGGDSYLSGYVKGFEVVPYPYLTKVEGLPPAVGDSYIGNTLFTYENGKYIANYEESLEYLELYGMTKKLLVSLGWDENKIYNVGGYWYYNGKNNIEVKKTIEGTAKYDFWKVTYHDIDFNSLTPAK